MECEGDPFGAAEKILEENGYSLDQKNGHWKTEARGEETDLQYLATAPPHGATSLIHYKEFVYDIRSAESNHLNTPHVHVSFDGQNISVDLTDFSYIGKVENPVKAHEAVRFIRANREDFLRAWHYTIGEKNIEKAYDLFRQPKYRQRKGVRF